MPRCVDAYGGSRPSDRGAGHFIRTHLGTVGRLQARVSRRHHLPEGNPRDSYRCFLQRHRCHLHTPGRQTDWADQEHRTPRAHHLRWEVLRCPEPDSRPAPSRDSTAHKLLFHRADSRLACILDRFLHKKNKSPVRGQHSSLCQRREHNSDRVLAWCTVHHRRRSDRTDLHHLQIRRPQDDSRPKQQHLCPLRGSHLDWCAHSRNLRAKLPPRSYVVASYHPCSLTSAAKLILDSTV